MICLYFLVAGQFHGLSAMQDLRETVAADFQIAAVYRDQRGVVVWKSFYPIAAGTQQSERRIRRINLNGISRENLVRRTRNVPCAKPS